MPPSHRLPQVNSHIQELFGEILEKELEFESGALVTITGVRTSEDLRSIKIGISIYPDKAANNTFALICRNLKTLKPRLYQKLGFKHVPEIRVYLDTRDIKELELQAALDKIKKSKP